MTRFSSKAARETAESKVRKAWGLDPFLFEAVARESLLFTENTSLPREKLHAMGLLVLSIVSLWGKALSKEPNIAFQAAELQREEKELQKRGAAHILRDLEKILTLTSPALTSNRRRTSFEIGTDGHPLTREAAVNLNLARHFEPISEEFSILIARIFANLTRYGAAYRAWERRLPLLICNLEKVQHVRVARELVHIEPSGIALVSPTIPRNVRTGFIKEVEGNSLFLIEDKENLFETILGVTTSDIYLLERRLSGWSLTYPLGNPSQKSLNSRRIPAWARLMALCGVSRKATEMEEAS